MWLLNPIVIYFEFFFFFKKLQIGTLLVCIHLQSFREQAFAAMNVEYKVLLS